MAAQVRRRSVKTSPGLSGQPCIGTSTAASVRPWASIAAASSGDRSASLGASRSDDHLHGAAVHAPGGTGDVGGLLGAEEDDHRGDLLHLGEPADRPLRPRRRPALRRGCRGRRAPSTDPAARPAPSTAQTRPARGRRRSRAPRRRRSGRRKAARATARPPSQRSTRPSPPRAACPRCWRRSRSGPSRARSSRGPARASDAGAPSRSGPTPRASPRQGRHRDRAISPSRRC